MRGKNFAVYCTININILNLYTKSAIRRRASFTQEPPLLVFIILPDVSPSLRRYVNAALLPSFVNAASTVEVIHGNRGAATNRRACPTLSLQVPHTDPPVSAHSVR
ncbi:hypothetical protein AMECASPLE_014048 [Ameca splendens]|uniref:Uncharacterized protein n=1 Tax=Ameca splendens TaxID=208324 RepID=A0ABV0ZXV5_9TELE